MKNNINNNHLMVIAALVLFSITSRATENCKYFFEGIAESTINASRKFPPAEYRNKRIRDNYSRRVILWLYEGANLKEILSYLTLNLGLKVDLDLISHDIILLDITSNNIYQQLGTIDGIRQISVDPGVGI